MSIHDVIANTPSPRTRATLAADLRRLEVMPGSVLMVHCSLRSLGWVCGAQTAVIQALQDALTPAGTLVMPSHSSDLTDPAQWSQPPVPHEWQRTIRDNMPAYHPQTTPTRGMGAVAEQFRTWPGVLRSAHPAFSLAAAGPHAAAVISPGQELFLKRRITKASSMRALLDAAAPSAKGYWNHSAPAGPGVAGPPTRHPGRAADG